jgi:hypothetical protein
MGRELAVGYGKNVRPYGSPRDGIEADVKVSNYVAGRNVQEMQAVFTAVDEPQSCSATKKNGDPCKGRPLEGSSLCVFHREAG